MTTAQVLAAGLGVVTLAAFTHAVTGFGFALVAVPLLSVLVGPREAVVAVVVVSLVLYLAASARTWADVDTAVLRRLLLPSAVGMPVGLLALLWLGERPLLALIAVATAGSTGLVAVLRKRGVRRDVTVPAGVTSGALLTATGMNGPPLVLACQALDLPPARTRASLQAAFAVQQVVAVGLFAAGGRVTEEVGWLVVAGLPALAAGWWLGDRVFARLRPERYATVVLVGLLGASLLSLVRAVA